MSYMKEAITVRRMKVTATRQRGDWHTGRHGAFMKSLFHAPLTRPWSIACIGADGKQAPSCSESHLHTCIGLRHGSAQVWRGEERRQVWASVCPSRCLHRTLHTSRHPIRVPALSRWHSPLKSQRKANKKALLMRRQKGFASRAEARHWLWRRMNEEH